MHTHSKTFSKLQPTELWLTYLLYGALLTAPIGIILSLYKTFQYRHLLDKGEREDERDLDTMLSHYEWLNQTALVTVLLAMMAIGTLYYFAGYLFALAALLWWVYRMGRGMVALLHFRAPS